VRRGIASIRRGFFVLLGLLVLCGHPPPALAQLGGTPTNDPPVPAGVHPEGAVTVALIGSGIDYTDPDLLPHLARDGEGFLLAYDFVDEDTEPFPDAPMEAGAGDLSSGERRTGDTELAIRISHSATDPAVAVAAFRVDELNLASIGAAAQMAKSAPTSLIVISPCIVRTLGRDGVFDLAEFFAPKRVVVPLWVPGEQHGLSGTGPASISALQTNVILAASLSERPDRGGLLDATVQAAQLALRANGVPGGDLPLSVMGGAENNLPDTPRTPDDTAAEPRCVPSF